MYALGICSRVGRREAGAPICIVLRRSSGSLVSELRGQIYESFYTTLKRRCVQ